MNSLSRWIGRSALGIGLAAATFCLPAGQAQAGGRHHSGVSISVGFRVGNHGYVSIGRHHSIGHRYHHHRRHHSHLRYDHHRYYRHHRVHVRPVSRVCHDDVYRYHDAYRYGYRDRYGVYDTPGVHRYSSFDGGAATSYAATDVYGYQEPARTVSYQSQRSATTFADVRVAPPERQRVLHQRAGTLPDEAARASENQAWALFEAGDTAEAQRVFARLSARQPRMATARVGYGLASAQLGHQQRAERAFANAGAADPNVWDRLGDRPAARAAAVDLLGERAWADSPVMRGPLARLSVAAEPVDLAMPDFERVVSRD